VLSFIEFRARKLLLSIKVFKLIFHNKVFSTKLYAVIKCFGRENLEQFFKVVPRNICGAVI